MCVLANILSYHPLRSSNSAHLLLAFRNQLDATSSSNQVVSPDVDVLPKEELAAEAALPPLVAAEVAVAQEHQMAIRNKLISSASDIGARHKQLPEDKGRNRAALGAAMEGKTRVFCLYL